MTIFDSYAKYYDLLYRDKDYVGEARYVSDLIRAQSPAAASILELGCGTGAHAAAFSDLGYELTGIDQSQRMLDSAQGRRKEAVGAERARRLSFARADIRTYRAGRSFDAVISLFHVMSYQTTAADLLASFSTAAAHLERGGVFVFDCWYGPGVLNDKPVVRVKRLEDARTEVVRIAEPTMHPAQNVVDVNYHVFLKDKASNRLEDFKETHRMRFLFAPEIEAFLSRSRFKLERHCEWMSQDPPSLESWNAVFVATRDA